MCQPYIESATALSDITYTIHLNALCIFKKMNTRILSGTC